MTGANSQEGTPGKSEPPTTSSTGQGVEIDDQALAVLLMYRAFVEIRYLAGPAQRHDPETSPADDLQRIRFLADLCHNMPGIAKPVPRRSSRLRAFMSSFDRAMDERPMIWIWNTAGPEGRAWILDHIEQAGHCWTPPPPLPTARKGVAPLTLRQRISLLWGWPVKTPPGRRPLPSAARFLKAVDSETICGLHEDAGRLRLGLGAESPWLRAHLDPTATHYVFPDPASYYWPDEERLWWQCRLLLHMTDGEQVTGSLAVLPETFTALPSDLPRRRQRRLALRARATERDTYLWGEDHKPHCSPERCGYTPPDEPTYTPET